jgi:hypothetical protein
MMVKLTIQEKKKEKKETQQKTPGSGTTKSSVFW